MAKPEDCAKCLTLQERLERLDRRLDRLEDENDGLRKSYRRVTAALEKANNRIGLLEAENAGLRRTLEKKVGQVKQLTTLHFAETSEAALNLDDVPVTEVKPQKPRGKQHGAEGFGRQIRSSLPVRERLHDLTPDQKRCAGCGKEHSPTPFAEESEEIDYEFKLVRVKHKRLRYRKNPYCKCPGARTFITAPAAEKLIPKGMFSAHLWSHILIEKFHLQRPLSRIRKSFQMAGLMVSEGVLTGGLKRLTKLFAPLYVSIRAENRQALHRHMDETHWRVYDDRMGKENHKWWIWASETDNTSLFILDPSRSASVPSRLLADINVGVVSCDRYSSYHPLLESGIQLAYCWAHVRRDFLKLRVGFRKHLKFANAWLKLIDELFHVNNIRRNQPSRANESAVKEKLTAMETRYHKQLRMLPKESECRSPLESLAKHWTGLTLFDSMPSIPMDNNAAERALRNLVVGRKNYYGSRSIWSGWLATMLFSLFSTLEKNEVDVPTYLNEYLAECARNKGMPPLDLSKFEVWKKRKTQLAFG
jgi:transposase